MKYKVPDASLSSETEENLRQIEKVIENLNLERDKGLSNNLLKNLKKTLLIKHVYNSNAIEGNKLSLRETELILDSMAINERPLKDEIEAKSLANATEYLYKLIDGSEQIGKRTLLELHEIIMKDTLGLNAGRFRTNEVQIKGSDHKPPHFNDVELHIEELFKWVNRNTHKHTPLVSAAILHHWLTWIHPFSDGNGRVSRLILNFYLLQKGYPEIIIKITERDNYYNSLIKADKGDLSQLIELLIDSIIETINIYEQYINEDQRQKAWLQAHKTKAADQYEKIRKGHGYQYEVWKNQMLVFKALLNDSLNSLNDILPHINIIIKDYDILTLGQYLDILEDRKISHTWFQLIRIKNSQSQSYCQIIFYFQKLKLTKPLILFGGVEAKNNLGENSRIEYARDIKLCFKIKHNGIPANINYEIDLYNIGTKNDQLSFGKIDRQHKIVHGKIPKILSKTDSPGVIIREFVDQILSLYLK